MAFLYKQFAFCIETLARELLVKKYLKSESVVELYCLKFDQECLEKQSSKGNLSNYLFYQNDSLSVLYIFFFYIRLRVSTRYRAGAWVTSQSDPKGHSSCRGQITLEMSIIEISSKKKHFTRGGGVGG